VLAQTFIFVINNVLAAVAAEAIVATLFAEAEEWRIA
jgi:hypothetical protein